MAHALRVKNALEPHCLRIAIAGSLRRGKTLVKDIDIVCVPKMAANATLFGTTAELALTDFYAAARRELGDIASEGTRTIRGVAAAPNEARLMCDLYIATPETWATLLLIRTGSAEHNIFLCSRAKQVGGKLHADGAGLELPGQYDPVARRTVNSRLVRPKDEGELFVALGMPYIEPEKREIWNGKPAWMASSGLPSAEDLDAVAEEESARKATRVREPGEEG